MATLQDTIVNLGSSMTINQGQFNLTSEYFELNEIRPLHCGDDFSFEFTYEDSDGNAIDITGATIRFTAKYDITDDDNEAIVQKTAVLTDPSNGVFTITLTDTDVVGPERIFGYYDIQLTESGGDTSTLVWGNIEFLPNITQTVP